MEEERLRGISFAGVEPAARRSHRGQFGPGTPERNSGHWPETPPTRIGSKLELHAFDPSASFLTWLLAKAGLTATAYRPNALSRRLPACLRALHSPSIEAAKILLEQQPESVPVAVGAVLIGVTRFFRDPAVFDELHRSVLPGLLAHRHGLRIYSAGCSDGQELYSIAIVLAELGALQTSHLLGMDCRPEAIARAKAGWFLAAEIIEVRSEFRERYFRVEGTDARISPLLREKLCWSVGDLLTLTPMEGLWDLILFRNVAIYLRSEQIEIWKRLFDQLTPGGVLVTGHAERPPSGLPLERVSSCIYRRKEK